MVFVQMIFPIVKIRIRGAIMVELQSKYPDSLCCYFNKYLSDEGK